MVDIGVMVGGIGLAALLEAVQAVADAGVRRAWLPQVFSGEALTTIAVAGRIRALADVGATELMAAPIGSRAVREETLRVLGALAQETVRSP
jgi:hypothetical protein